MNIDIFGARHSRYARRNSHNMVKAKLEAASEPQRPKSTSFVDNLAAALKRPVVKRAAATTTTPNDIGKPIGTLFLGRIVAVHKCENGVCRRVLVKKCIKS